MLRSQIYGADTRQSADQPLSPTNVNTPGVAPVPSMGGGQAVTFSWVGILIALILWRIVYEMSE